MEVGRTGARGCEELRGWQLIVKKTKVWELGPQEVVATRRLSSMVPGMRQGWRLKISSRSWIPLDFVCPSPHPFLSPTRHPNPTWYLLVELKGIPATLGFLSLIFLNGARTAQCT